MSDEAALPDEQTLRVERAYHEAGHAIAAHRLGEKVIGLTIEKEGSFDSELFEAFTHVEFDDEKFTADVEASLRRCMTVGLAGAIGESFVGRQIPPHEQKGIPLSHYEMVALYADYEERNHGADGEEFFGRLYDDAYALITEGPGWDAYIEISNSLADGGALSREQFLSMLAANGLPVPDENGS